MNSPTPSAAGQPLPKSLFGFDVIEKLGDGAKSVVYLVSDPKTGQVYALKHVVRTDDKSDRFFEQLENEYAVGLQFRHPSLRKSIELKNNKSFLRKMTEAALVMEMFDGTPLDEQPLHDLPTTLEIFIKVARGLEALHYQRVVHCDFKPGNVLMNPDGRIKVIDFGQAAKAGTTKDRVQGTPDFVAPEQVKLRAVTERTDIWSFGAALYWALTGKRVPTLYTIGKGQRDVLKEQSYPSPLDLNPKVPKVLSDLIMKCLYYEPSGRPDNMRMVAEQLERIARELKGA